MELVFIGIAFIVTGLQEYIWTIIKIIGGFCFGIYLWQFIARQCKWEKRPSWVLKIIADFLTDLFITIGKIVARISSLVEYVKFEMFYIPLFELLVPIYEICISWLWFFTGYYDYVSKFAKTSIVYMGSYWIIFIPIFIYDIWSIWNELIFSPVGFFFILIIPAIKAGIIYAIIVVVYYVGNFIHYLIKFIWETVNENDALLTTKESRKEMKKKKNVKVMEKEKEEEVLLEEKID